MKKLYALIIGLLIAFNCANVQACDACGKGKKKKKQRTSWAYTIAQTPTTTPAAPVEKPKTTTPAATTSTEKPKTTAVETPMPTDVTYVDALDVLKNPKTFLNKPIYIKAKFDKFSTLGLDYPPVNRSTADYITFLVQRSDSPSHDIPLSEVKFFMKRSYAEKFIDLETGDMVHMHGKMFSNALGDAWVDIDKIEIKEKVKKTDK